MRMSISAITTLPTDLETDLHAFASAGWTAVELSLEKAQTYAAEHSVNALADLLARHGLAPVGAIGLAPSGPGLLLADGDARAAYFRSLDEQLRLCAALGVPTLGLGADPVSPHAPADWRVRAAANVRDAGKMAAEHGIKIGVEFMSLNPPIGPFMLANLEDTLDLVEAASHPAVGVNLDAFHFFRGGGTVPSLADLDAGLISIIHVCDVVDLPRSAWQDGDRVYPGQGILPLRELRAQMDALGYEGVWSLELLNESYWAASPYDVAVEGKRAMEAVFGPQA